MKKDKEIGIPKDAPAAVKREDAKLDKAHGTKEGSKADLKLDHALMAKAKGKIRKY